MNPSTDINFNQCVKSISNFGETVYQNICNGAISKVPWGTMDWVSVIFLCAFGFVFLAMITGLLLTLLGDL